MKIRIVLIIIFLLIISAYINFKDKKGSLIVNNQEIKLLIANNDYSRKKGLSDKESMQEDEAMIFIFDKMDKYGFWMKDMKFPIDIVWMNDKKEIIDIKSDINQNSYPEIFFPNENALYIIEFNAGFSDKNKVKVGNILNFRI